MQPIPLYFVWQYNDVDRAFSRRHLEDWVPRRLIDAHTHRRFARVPASR